VTPAMRPSARSSGVATVAAMVSGLAPATTPTRRSSESLLAAAATPAAD
jgi:hypothetical protein